MADAMRTGGGKSKGSQFERDVCVALSKWVSNDGSSSVFWRSAMSGGRATVAFKKSGTLHGSQVGDISCISPVGGRFIDTFAIECKFYHDLEWKGLLTGKGKLLAFWDEINQQASRYNKQPFLVARQNRMPTFVCLNGEGVTELELPQHATTLISVPYDMYVFDFKQFLQVCEPYVANSRRSSPNRQRTRLTPV